MIKEGTKIRIAYIGKTDEGQVFEVWDEESPLEITIGETPLLPVFEKGLMGKKEGDEFSIRILCKDAYGEYSEEKKKFVPYEYEVEITEENIEYYIDKNPEAKVGMKCNIPTFPGEIVEDQILVARDSEGDEVKIIVKEVHEKFAVLDGNHPLAGFNLNYEIKIIEEV
jgi:FKBP-type peptidyl-prolyl cis-trans isomerase 2